MTTFVIMMLIGGVGSLLVGVGCVLRGIIEIWKRASYKDRVEFIDKGATQVIPLGILFIFMGMVILVAFVIVPSMK